MPAKNKDGAVYTLPYKYTLFAGGYLWVVSCRGKMG